MHIHETKDTYTLEAKKFETEYIKNHQNLPHNISLY